MSGARIDSIVAKLVISNLDPSIEAPKDLDCRNCGMCCKGVSPLLTTQEVLSGLYPMMFVNPPDDVKEKIPDAKWMIVMASNPYHGCPWLDENNRCRHYDLRPLACRQFDCRTATNQPFPTIAKLRFGICANDKEEKEKTEHAKKNSK
jgi:Fe-S-cluster containining protein